MKKILKYIILVFVFTIILTGCSNKHIKNISYKDFKKKIESKETFIVYIGRENCSHCISYRPTLESVLNEYNIDIYYLGYDKLTEKQSSEILKYINISGTPTVAFFTKGEEESTLDRIVGDISKEETIQKFKDNGYIK